MRVIYVQRGEDFTCSRSRTKDSDIEFLRIDAVFDVIDQTAERVTESMLKGGMLDPAYQTDLRSRIKIMAREAILELIGGKNGD